MLRLISCLQQLSHCLEDDPESVCNEPHHLHPSCAEWIALLQGQPHHLEIYIYILLLSQFEYSSFSFFFSFWMLLHLAPNFLSRRKLCIWNHTSGAGCPGQAAHCLPLPAWAQWKLPAAAICPGSILPSSFLLSLLCQTGSTAEPPTLCLLRSLLPAFQLDAFQPDPSYCSDGSLRSRN